MGLWSYLGRPSGWDSMLSRNANLSCYHPDWCLSTMCPSQPPAKPACGHPRLWLSPRLWGAAWRFIAPSSASSSRTRGRRLQAWHRPRQVTHCALPSLRFGARRASPSRSRCRYRRRQVRSQGRSLLLAARVEWRRLRPPLPSRCCCRHSMDSVSLADGRCALSWHYPATRTTHRVLPYHHGFLPRLLPTRFEHPSLRRHPEAPPRGLLW